MEKEEFSLKKEIKSLADIVSGERVLRQRQEEIEKKKEEAKELEKIERKRRVVKGDDYIPKEDDIENRKVVQNIKKFEWESPDIVKIRFTKKAFLILLGASMLLVLYFAILGQYALMMALLALVFLIYVYGTAEPRSIKYKITSRGIDIGSKLYEWYMLDSFYFTKKEEKYFFFVDTKLKFPPSLVFLIEKEDKDPLFVILQDKILYKDVRSQSRLSKLSYGEYIPLEKV